MKTRPDIYLPTGYLRPGIIATPGTPSEVLPQVLNYFAPPGARLPHKFRQTFKDNVFFRDWLKGKFYADEYDNAEIQEFFVSLQTWVQAEEQALPFHFFDFWNTALHGAGIRFDFEWYADDYANGKLQVFETMPPRKPQGVWSLETDAEIQLWKSRTHLYTIKK